MRLAGILQVIGAAALVVGIGLAAGYAFGIIAAGAASILFGVAKERE